MLNKAKEFLLPFFKKYLTKSNAKKFAGPIIIAILTVLIPLTIAVCYMQFVKGGQRVESPEISVSLYDSKGTLIDSDTTQEDIVDASPLANIFYKLTFSKVKAQKPSEFNKKQNMSYTIRYNSDSTTFKCYFEEDSELSYLEDQNGNFFSPDALAYSMLLSSKYSEVIYKESVPPTLITPLGEQISPNQVEWTYTLKDGSTKHSSNYKTDESILTYRIAGAISFDFSRTPDVCAITVQALSGETIFSGSIEDLSALTVEENTELLISINAKWKKSSDVTSYGYQDYDFKIICSEPSTFSISSNEAIGGQALLLSVSDVYKVDSIFYSPISSLEDIENEIKASDKQSEALKALYSYSPIFVKEGSNAYALIPIPADIPDTEFTFSISCGISKENITVKLKKSTASDALVNGITLTDAQKAEFSRILLHLNHSKSDVLLLNDGFILPDSYGFTQSQKYNTSINNSFTLLGNSYSSNGEIGTSVQSANIGAVSAVGFSPLLGNYVIVDHGMGLLSWYCGLSAVSVKENDILKKGDTIGRAGSSSIFCENGVNILTSVGGVLINPDGLVSD